MAGRKRRSDSLYRPRYAKKLAAGLRKDGLSVAEVAAEFGISVVTYYHWIDTIPDFKQAAEIGKRDHSIWWQKLARQVACGEVKGNAGVLAFAMKNMEEGAWVDKREIHNTSDDEIRTIQIEVLPRQQPKCLEVNTYEQLEDQSDRESS